ncbi:MAG: hypothetical protein WC985_04515 [Thermoplasmata archaeon]
MHLPPLETDRLLVRPFEMVGLDAVHPISSTPMQDEDDLKEHREILQLCDLLTGSVALAFSGASNIPVKKSFARRAARMIRMSEPASKVKQKPFWDRFYVAVFPDERGKFRTTMYPLAQDRVSTLSEFGSPP